MHNEYTPALIQDVLSEENLQSAYAWLCDRRAQQHANASIWNFRWHWPTRKKTLRQDILAGTVQFKPLQEVRLYESIHYCWAPEDALRLKALANVLKKILPLPSCGHLAGNGLKKTLNAVENTKSQYVFFIRTDVKGYYANIDKGKLYGMLSQYISDPLVLALLHQSLYYATEYGGTFHTPEKGIALGSPLSPLMGALYLKPMDDDLMAQNGIFYRRYMDDWVIFTTKRWHLKNAIKHMNHRLNSLGLEKHPHKTEIGRITRGFDFLGHHFSGHGKGITLAKTTFDRCFAKLNQLYEQQPTNRVLDHYWRRWLSWVTGGISLDTFDLCGWITQTTQWLQVTVAPLVGPQNSYQLWRSLERHVSRWLSGLHDAVTLPCLEQGRAIFHAGDVMGQPSY